MSPQSPAEIRDALALLDKRRLVLAIHDGSFPSAPGEDTGRGTPYSRGGAAFAAFARALGFDGLQLGPQGQTSSVNQSPYDGTLFSKNILSIDLHGLARDPLGQRLVSAAQVDALVAGNPRSDGRRVAYRHVFDGYCTLLEAIQTRFEALEERGDEAGQAIAQDLAAFRDRSAWLRHDALYEALCVDHGHIHWRHWPRSGESAFDRLLCCPPPGAEALCAARRKALRERYRRTVGRYELGQLIVHRQHQSFRELVRPWGLRLYGDVQVGMSPRDTWSRQPLLLADYLLGAPPSRTNPDGQPWSHGVLDPAQYRDAAGGPGAAVAFLAQRLGKMLEEFDGLRIDHPHGLVCPWVYRADDLDPFHAVQTGARLFSSPNLPEHPGLARYAIARPDQLSQEPGTPRYADDWVRSLEPAQVERYAILLDALMAQVRAHGRDVEDVLCEVLSTQPFPLARVLRRYGLGRFRVTQKARLDDPQDVYRSDNACPQDWVMVGNHDTPPIWRLARRWQGDPEGERQAWHLARRLCPAGGAERLARVLMADRYRLVHAKLADLFASPARHVMVFFPDLLGMEETYNTPGTVNEENWTLRVPPDYGTRYPADAARGAALNLPCVLALALRSKGADFARQHAALIVRLEGMAGWSVGENP